MNRQTRFKGNATLCIIDNLETLLIFETPIHMLSVLRH